ncbi:lysophospholipase [Aliiroseovarius crassostreae]|uniref:Hydrolase n=1 Tax=Aliiroseovarius crassostreae TaxID=154981 RepID=A0A0P7KHG3_9RHOB|nr:alpha/beta hydrolase [Aliiroseovarius crassostreae]KPN62888.1 hydrolase [Aliiroseovarius crassostreae]SFU97158.1 lysophospholipase [Aliiroseovarius crassostreae]
MDQAPLYPEIAEAPEGGSAYWVYAKDRVRLRVGLWKPDSPQKGTVFVFPGRSEYIEKYGRTITELSKLGFGTFLIDWRGQGLADRSTTDAMTGHVDRFSDYHKDVAAMIEAAEELSLPKPWYLIGHSLGACIGLRALIDGFPMSACAFTGPMWNIKLPAVKRAAAWPLSWAAQTLGKGHIYAPGTDGTSYVLSTPYEANRLTNDAEMYEYYIRQATTLTDHQIGGPSLGWLFQTLKETKALSKVASPEIPCITFCGEQDEVVEISAVRDRMSRWPGGRLEMIPNARHDVFSEVPEIRNGVVARIGELFSMSDVETHQAAG